MALTGPESSFASPVHCIIIPNELYRQILQSLAGDLKTLCAVAQCSRLLQAEAERFIYSHLKFEVDNFANRRRLFGMLLHVVDKAPYRAKLVHSWEMSFSGYMSATMASPLEAEYVVEALKAMDNLKVLKVLDEQGHLTLRPSDLLVDLQNSETKFQLEEFGWNTHIEDPESFFGFLRKQNKLRKLDVSWPAPGVRPCFSPGKVRSGRDYSPKAMQDTKIPPDVAKDITHLVGTYNTIRAFLPGRPVTDLTWFVGEPKTAYAGVIPPDVLEGLKGVRHFRTAKEPGFLGNGSSVPAFIDLTRWLVNVETLRLSWIHVAERELECIKTLHQLKYVCFRDAPRKLPRKVVESLFIHSNTLQTLELHAHNAVEKEHCLRWYEHPMLHRIDVITRSHDGRCTWTSESVEVLPEP